ncbi:MAG: zinc ribbon domain-containing protein [Oscillospiraceae bacterium]|nr:zinc ribbon domain-containing protein [Oscillospiraceae bacterium]
MFCSQCGIRTDDSAKFCPGCGAPMMELVTVEQQGAPVQQYQRSSSGIGKSSALPPRSPRSSSTY